VDRPLGSARRYASALLAIAGDGAAAEALLAELDRVAGVVGTPGARTLLDDPRTPAAARVSALEAAAGAPVSAAVRTLMGTLASRRHLGRLPAIAEATRQALNEQNGISTAWVSTPTEIGADERSKIEAQAKAIAGGGVHVSYDIDPSLVGGVTLRVGDLLIDGSVRGKLARMRERILTAAG
jgi:F-type H+-transporting ATPase subunit delta